MKVIHAEARSSAAARAALLALAVLVGTGAPAAFAQQPPAPPMSIAPPSAAAPAPQSMMRNRPAGVTRYEDVATQRSFVVDRTDGKTLMRVEDSPEVFALRSTTAQRGDAFLRSDTGQLMLRVTEQGNVISYLWDKDGAPADMAGAAAPLHMPSAVSASLNERRVAAAETLRRYAGSEVTIFGTGEFAGHEAWAVDMLTVLELGVQRASELSNDSVSKLKAVRLTRANKPAVGFDAGELVVAINPLAGYAGRPSSDAVAVAIAASN